MLSNCRGAVQGAGQRKVTRSRPLRSKASMRPASTLGAARRGGSPNVGRAPGGRARQAVGAARLSQWQTACCASLCLGCLALLLAGAARLRCGRLGGVEALGLLEHREEDGAADADPHDAGLPAAAGQVPRGRQSGEPPSVGGRARQAAVKGALLQSRGQAAGSPVCIPCRPLPAGQAPTGTWRRRPPRE